MKTCKSYHLVENSETFINLFISLELEGKFFNLFLLSSYIYPHTHFCGFFVYIRILKRRSIFHRKVFSFCCTIEHCVLEVGYDGLWIRTQTLKKIFHVYTEGKEVEHDEVFIKAWYWYYCSDSTRLQIHLHYITWSKIVTCRTAFATPRRFSARFRKMKKCWTESTYFVTCCSHICRINLVPDAWIYLS